MNRMRIGRLGLVFIMLFALPAIIVGAAGTSALAHASAWNGHAVGTVFAASDVCDACEHTGHERGDVCAVACAVSALPSMVMEVQPMGVGREGWAAITARIGGRSIGPEAEPPRGTTLA
jgi:hypothetical protein